MGDEKREADKTATPAFSRPGASISTEIEALEPGEALDDNLTAQYRAFQWLAFEDPTRLPIKETNQTILIERYGAAHIRSRRMERFDD